MEPLKYAEFGYVGKETVYLNSGTINGFSGVCSDLNRAKIYLNGGIISGTRRHRIRFFRMVYSPPLFFGKISSISKEEFKYKFKW